MNPLSLKLCLAGVFSFNKVIHKPLFPDVGHKWICQGDNVVSPFEGIVVYSQCACSHVCIQSVCLQSFVKVDRNLHVSILLDRELSNFA